MENHITISISEGELLGSLLCQIYDFSTSHLASKNIPVLTEALSDYAKKHIIKNPEMAVEAVNVLGEISNLCYILAENQRTLYENAYRFDQNGYWPKPKESN